MKKIIVCGGRHLTLKRFVCDILDAARAKHGEFVVVQGGARGADTLARDWAERRCVDDRTYRAKWNDLGRAAGHERNARMLEDSKAEAVIAFPGGKGTANMVHLAKKAGVPVWQPGEQYHAIMEVYSGPGVGGRLFYAGHWTASENNAKGFHENGLEAVVAAVYPSHYKGGTTKLETMSMDALYGLLETERFVSEMGIASDDAVF